MFIRSPCTQLLSSLILDISLNAQTLSKLMFMRSPCIQTFSRPLFIRSPCIQTFSRLKFIRSPCIQTLSRLMFIRSPCIQDSCLSDNSIIRQYHVPQISLYFPTHDIWSGWWIIIIPFLRGHRLPEYLIFDDLNLIYLP